MAGQLVSNVSGYGSTEFDTKIPALTDTANIQEAFLLYHYGLDNYDGSTPPASDSIESHLSGIDGRITDLENTPSGGGLVQNNIPHLLTKADSSLTTLPEGYIWVDGDGSVASITEAGTVTYTNNEPSEPTHGMVWIDKDYTVAPVNISNYLSSADASSTYLTQTSASTTYAPKESPTFTGTAIIPTATITTVNATDIASTGLLSIQEATETVVNGSISSGSLTANFNDGNIFYISASPTANFTINATNVPTTNDRIITMSFIVKQGSTGYYPNVFAIAGTTQTIRWTSGTAPTPTSTANDIDIFNFTLLRTGSSWVVIANSALDI